MSVYEVERIVGHKYIKDELYYRVKWMGYPQVQDCHHANLDNCQLLINDYLKLNNLAPLPSHRGEKKKEPKYQLITDQEDDEPDFISYPFIMIETKKENLTYDGYHKVYKIPQIPKSENNDPIILNQINDEKAILSNIKYGNVEIKYDTCRMLFG